MPKAAVTAGSPELKLLEGDMSVSGDLTFATVAALRVRSLALFAGHGFPRCLDLSGVTRVDSAGLSLLLEWLRAARADGHALQFRAVPEQLLAIARAGGLEAILSQHVG